MDTMSNLYKLLSYPNQLKHSQNLSTTQPLNDPLSKHTVETRKNVQKEIILKIYHHIQNKSLKFDPTLLNKVGIEYIDESVSPFLTKEGVKLRLIEQAKCGGIYKIIGKNKKVYKIRQKQFAPLLEREMATEALIQAVASQSNNVPKVYKFIKINEYEYAIEMDELDPTTLYAHRYENKLTLEQRINILITTFEALDTLHANGFCHNDFHVNNILVSKNGSESFLIDFEKSKLKTEEGLKKDYRMVGTNAEWTFWHEPHLEKGLRNIKPDLHDQSYIQNIIKFLKKIT